MPRCRTPPESPRHRKRAGFLVVPPRGAHPVPSVEVDFACFSSKAESAQYSDDALCGNIGSAQQTEKLSRLTCPDDDSLIRGSSQDSAFHTQATSLIPLLLANFGKIHSCNAQILARLQSEDFPLEGVQTKTSRRSITSKNSSQPRRKPSPKELSVDFKARTLTGESLSHHESSGVIDGGLGAFGYKSSGFTNTSSANMYSMAASISSNMREMEKLSRIIESHSKILARKHSMAHHLWLFLENRTSSRWAYFYGSYIAPFLLIMSVAISFFQTSDWAMPEDVFTVIQSTFEVWFATEISLRFLVCPNKWTFWFDAFNAIDFISVVPLFLRIYVWVADIERGVLLQVIALVPMLRLLKVLRRFHKFQLLLSAFNIALEALPVLIFSLMLIAIIFSGLMYLVESRDNIEGLVDSLWFVMVTMTTVGYGDITPDTMIGRAFAVLLMILSALYMALPIGIVGNAFSEVWKDRDRLLLLAVLRESFTISGVSRALIKEIFLQFGSEPADKDSDMTNYADPEMDFDDFKNLIRALQLDIPEDRLLYVFDALDADGGGTISCDEFLLKLFPSRFYEKRANPTVYTLESPDGANRASSSYTSRATISENPEENGSLRDSSVSPTSKKSADKLTAATNGSLRSSQQSQMAYRTC